MSASVVQQTTRNQKRSFSKQNLITHYRGKRKSKDVKEPEQKNRVQRGAIIGMVRGDTSRKRPREQSEQRASNDISFPSMLGCQLVDSPIILEALIECFRVRRISVDEGSSSEVMYEHCFRNLRAETKAKLKESRTPLVGFSGEASYPIGTINLNVTIGEPGKLRTILMKFAVNCNNDDQERNPPRTSEDGRSTRADARKEDHPPKMQTSEPEKTTSKDNEKDEPLEKSLTSNPSEKVVIHKGYPDQTITIGGNLTGECRSGLIKMLRKHADAFAWTLADMTVIPRSVAEHELKTYPHIEPRVQRKMSIAPDRRKVVKDEVTE
ncbi:hypothetical protein Tco_1239357 [Tanacetum coccineum]